MQNLIPYTFNIKTENRKMPNSRKGLRFLLACLGVSASISVAKAAYDGEKENNIGWAITTSVCFSICESALSTWIYLKVEEELRYSLSENNQEISEESRFFRISKNSISFALGFTVALVCYILPTFHSDNPPDTEKSVHILLSTMYFMTRIVCGFYFLFNYLGKLSLPLAHQRAICHYHANIDRTFPNFLGPSSDMKVRRNLPALQSEFYDDLRESINIPLWQEEKLSAYITSEQNRNFIFLKKSIPMLTLVLVVSINIPILIFSLKDTSQDAKKANLIEELSQVLFATISFPADLILDCYIINKLLQGLLDITYDEETSDYIARNFPNTLIGVTLFGLLLSILSISAYKHYPFCETLQAMAVSNSIDVVGYIATMVITSIEHIFACIEVAKIFLKFYVEIFGNNEEKDKLIRIFGRIEGIKASISRIRSDVDVSEVPEAVRFDVNEPQNIFERGFNHFFNKKNNQREGEVNGIGMPLIIAHQV